MKHPVLFLLLLFLSFTPLTLHAAEKSLPSRFELTREINASFRTGQRGRLLVAGDVFGQARNFPNDLRLFGSDETQWPFFLYIPTAKTETKKLKPTILNRSFVTGSEPYLQFDLLIPPVGGKIPVHNQLELITSGHDFVRRVELFSANPEQASGHMATGFLIHFSRQRNARNRIIRYPASDAQRLTVRIYSNAQSAHETFELTTARLLYRTITKTDYETVAFESLNVPKRECEKKAQTLLLDIEIPDRPVERILFDIEKESYARSLSVFGRNKEIEPWHWVGGGEIHRLAGDSKTSIKLQASDRFLKIHLFHYDDQPLLIKSIHLEAIPRYLVFEAATDGNAALYFRAWDMKPARYDLKGRIKKKTIPSLPIFQTLETKPNQTAGNNLWRSYSKFLGILAVAVVSLLVIWVITSMLRQIKRDQN